MLKKLFTHSFLYSIAPQVPKLVSLVLMPIMTAYLKPEDYGIYGIITSYLFFFTALKDLGLSVVFVNTFYKFPQRWRWIWRMLHGHLILWTLFYALLLLAVLYLAIPGSALGNFWLIAFLILFPAICFDTTVMIGNYYFRFSEQPGFLAVASISTTILSTLVTYYCVVHLHLGYLSWFVSAFFSSICFFLFYAWPVYGRLKLFPIIRFKKSFIRPHLKVALPMVPHNYSSYLLNSSDRVVLNSYKVDIGQIGLYNLAYQFGNYFEAFGEAVGMAVGPFYSKLYSSRDKKALVQERDLTFFLMTFFLAATFLVSIWIKEAFHLLVRNDALRPAYSLGILLVMGYSYRPMYWSAGIKLSMAERTGLLWRISFVAGVINVVLNLIFIPFFGIYAAAINTLISLLYMGFSGYFFPTYRKMPGEDHYPLLWMFLILLLTGIAYAIKDVSIGIKTSLTVALLTGCAFLYWKFLPKLKSIQI